MMYIIGRYKYVLLAVGCLLLTACSSSSDDTGDTRTSSPLQVVPYTSSYHENNGGMRAVTVPSGYSSYTPDFNVSIGLFPIQTHPTPVVEPATAKVISYSNGIWHTQVVVETNFNYTIYGYMPMRAPVTGAVSYTDKTLTLSHVGAVTADDICFVAGVKEGKTTDDVSLVEGAFAYTGKGDENYVCLLMDHLYAAIRFHFSINADYAALRTIKLKSMTLKSNYESVTATVDLSGVPAVVTYAPVTGTTPSAATFFEHREGLDISDASAVETIKGYTCCFSLVNSQNLTLVSTYDVYDRKGNLIRQDCTSTNTLPSLENLEAKRGDLLTLNLNVNPTYLYQLSDQDLDNLINIQ